MRTPEEVRVRLDGVEVKVNVDAVQTQAAVQVLGLQDQPTWKIFFIEDVTTGLISSTPLLDQHLIIRARQKAKGADDVTVKFRPGRRSQLSTRWLDLEETEVGDLKTEFKVEEDWAVLRRSLGISLTAERPEGVVAAAVDAGHISALLTKDQRELIDECADARVNLDVLSPLPAVTAMRFPTFTVPGPGGDPLKVRAERWTVHPLDFLELSIAVDVDVAEASQRALEEFVVGNGLRAAAGEAKTSQVMQLLVAAAAAS
jgi:hypothetical protein